MSDDEVKTEAAPEPENKDASTEVKASGKKFDFNSLVHRLWQGKVALPEAFWLYFFAVVIGLGVVGNVLGPLSKFFSILSTIWAGFMIKPIWVAADKFEGAKHWATAAKIAAVLIGITVVGDLLAF